MVRIHASILAICAGQALASGTCQSEAVAEDVSLLQGRHTMRKHAALQPQAQAWDGSGSPPEGPGWHSLDLTVGDIPERQNKARQFEEFYRFGNARQHVMYAPAGEKGICMAVVEPTPGFGHATTGPILGNPENHYSPDGSTPFSPRDDTVSAAELKGDNAIGLMLPFPTPRRLRLRMSSANVVEDNAPTLFSEMQLSVREIDQSQLTRSHFPVTQGFMGIQTGLPQDISGGADNYESWYIRPSNGAGPGPNQFNPTTSAQFCADPGFEWFWLRSHAFDGSNGAVPTDPTTNFVFEGSAQTNFANEDIDSMLENANTLEYTFDDADTGVNMVVNGQRVVSAVTNEPFDRSVFGSREASVLSGSRTAIMFEPGVYLCVQSIEWLNEEEEEDAAPELPPVPPATEEQQTVVEAEALLTQELVDECNDNRRTGGTCFFSNCFDWRGATECRRGRCVCAEGTCSAREFGNSGRRGVCFQPLEWQEKRLQR